MGKLFGDVTLNHLVIFNNLNYVYKLDVEYLSQSCVNLFSNLFNELTCQ